MKNAGLEFSKELVRDLKACGAQFQPQAALSNYTTFQLGGPCPALIDCPSENALKAAWALLVDNNVSRMLIGGGSNLLFNDAGIDKVVVRYVEPNAVFKSDGSTVTVSAGYAKGI